MKIAVCLTAYNRADMIRETLDSIVAQTRKNFKVCLCRDGSTDNIDDIVAIYSKLLQIEVSPYKEDTSVGKAKNRAIELALQDPEVEFIQIIDSDDLMMPDMLETNIETMEANAADWVLCWSRTFGRNEGYVPSQIFSAEDLYEVNRMHSWVMARAKVFHHYKFKPVTGNEDWDWWVRVLRDNSLKGSINEKQVHRYRIHNGRISETHGIPVPVMQEQIRTWNPTERA